MRPYIQYYNSSVDVVARLEEEWLNSRRGFHLLQNFKRCSGGKSSLLSYEYCGTSAGGGE